ncbi:MAG: ABC transporter permease [Oligoflexia bacterium]|nr:ABC transporter permease [Oligoflexia bacterium]
MLETLRLCVQLTKRNWIVYRKDLIANVSPTIFEPIFLILSLGVGLGYFITDIDGRSYTAFLAPGLAVSTALFSSFFESSYGFYIRMTFENIFKAMLTTPIGVHEVILGEYIWLSIKGAMMCSLLAIGFACFGLIKSLWLLPLIPIAGVLIALPCGALGLIATSYVKNINQFQTVYAFFIAPLFFFSGIFFPLAQMPNSLKYIAYALPLAHGVEVSRALFWNENVLYVLGVHGGILILYSAILCAFAYYRIQKILQN